MLLHNPLTTSQVSASKRNPENEIQSNSLGHTDLLKIIPQLIERIQLEDLESFSLLNLADMKFDFLSNNHGLLFGIQNERLKMEGIHPLFPYFFKEDLKSFGQLSGLFLPMFRKLTESQREHYNFNFDIRLTKPNGSYRRILFLNTCLSISKNGLPKDNLIRYFDITNLKHKDAPMMIHFKLKNKTLGSWQQDDLGDLVNLNPLFTKKEAAIATLMTEGLSTEEIALSLSGQLKTIELHRKRLCHKTGSRNGLAFGILHRLGLW